jgi:SAM-dependent methyltransferase
MTWTTKPLRLLPREMLVKTNEFDHAAWNYEGLLGYVSRRRFALVAALLPARRLDRLLEIGYGSGIFMPELADRAEHVSGIDVHDNVEAVTASLSRAGIAADLKRAGAEALPYDDATFDAVVAVSALEFVNDLEATFHEISRVLKSGGRAIVVTPGDHPLLDAALRLATGASARSDFGDRRARVLAAMSDGMSVVASARFPRYSPIPIYRAFALESRSDEHS